MAPRNPKANSAKQKPKDEQREDTLQAVVSRTSWHLKSSPDAYLLDRYSQIHTKDDLHLLPWSDRGYSSLMRFRTEGQRLISSVVSFTSCEYTFDRVHAGVSSQRWRRRYLCVLRCAYRASGRLHQVSALFKGIGLSGLNCLRDRIALQNGSCPPLPFGL